MRRKAPRVRPGARQRVRVARQDGPRGQHAREPALNRLATADVIVTLENGADLPAAFLSVFAQRQADRHSRLRARPGAGLGCWRRSPTAPTRTASHFNRAARKHDALSSVRGQRERGGPGQRHQQSDLYSYTGAGVTVAFIDSGITSYQHPDLADGRVLAFVDFVNGRTTALRRQRPRHARRRHHRRQRQALGEEIRGHRAGRLAGLAQGARPGRRRHGRQHPQGARLGLHQRRSATASASSTCRSARRSPSRTTPTR